uniref:Uncharacterized protein n=1 Tax=Brassica campestris TaxID=3711 RepID=A0A3P5YER3_BRACM|nr:unnamed protein product [Brassica rapa]
MFFSLPLAVNPTLLPVSFHCFLLRRNSPEMPQIESRFATVFLSRDA